ncbi:MAG: hypothetical protein LBR66_04710 [Candidatus Symbiothrix sp.]|jgi:hypothetical protein|nr:hypothetical protein [Candidatus Symbiothrix sp.]
MTKQVASIFMLSILALASSHATLVLHFCGGNFDSASVAGYAPIRTCCCATRANSHSTEQQSVNQSPCCSNIFLQIDTDNFIVQQEISTEQQSIDYKYFTTEDIISTFISEKYITNIPFAPPPDGLERSGASIRHFCCSYLI